MTAPAADAWSGNHVPAELGRWGMAGLAVLAAHLALAVVLLAARPALDAADEPPAAILIDLAAAPSEPAPMPAPPVQSIDTPPDEPVEQETPDEPAQPEVDPLLDAPVVVARLPRARPDAPPARRQPAAKPTAARPKPQHPAEASAAPARTATARRAAKAAAPQAGAKPARPSISPDRWRSAVFRHLERRKRYPRAAEGAAGTVRVSFTIDAGGNIVRHRIAGSSGNAQLDQAAADMLRRASPVPAPPADIFRPGLTLQVPVRFSSR